MVGNLRRKRRNSHQEIGENMENPETPMPLIAAVKTVELDWVLGMLAAELQEEGRSLFSRDDIHSIADKVLDRRNALSEEAAIWLDRPVE